MKKFYINFSALFLILTGIILVSCLTPSSNTRNESINVLLISIDTIRPDRISSYSKKYLNTPHIDALASKSTLFERAVAHNPLTLPSHVNILTGTTPLFHNVHENSKSILAEDFFTLAECLKGEEYSTGAFVAAFPLDSRFGLSQGFDVYDESYPSKASSIATFQERNAGQVINTALDWIKKQNSKWFSFIHIWDPHAPYIPPEPFKSKFKDDPYSGEVAYVDSELGKLFDYLEDNNLIENTLIILTGDHGESLGDHGEATHGYFAYNSTLWIPLMIAAPGIKTSRVDEYVCHIDIFPTICEILGIGKPSFLQGISLLPLMKGKKIQRRAIYFESLNAYLNWGWAPIQGFIEEKTKFIDSPLPESYSLENDFKEENNLIDKINLDRSRKKLEDLKEKLLSPRKGQKLQITARETREKLRSFGYISSPISQLKESYGPEDDLKTLLPFEQKHALAMSYLDDNKVAEAVKLLNDIIKERKDLITAYTNLANIYRSQGLIEDAFAALELGYKNNPENYRIISEYGVFLIKEGTPDKEEILDKGIEFLQMALKIIDYDPDVWSYLGIASNKKGEFQKALNFYEKALSLDGNDALIHNNLGYLHFSISRQTKKMKDLSLSIECYQKAIEIDPALASAYNGLGGAYRTLGRIDNAISVWEMALKLDEDYDFPVYNLGLAYFEKGKKTQALKHFEKYLQLKKYEISLEERQKVEELIRKCKD